MLRPIAFDLPRFLRAVPDSSVFCHSKHEVLPPLLPPYVAIAIKCPCGCEDFSLTGYKWTNPEIGDAEPGWISPVTASCKQCFKVAFVIDTMADGYNAEIGDGESSAIYGPATAEAKLRSIVCNQCKNPNWQLTVGLGFNADEDERRANLEQMPDKKQSDLFESVSISGICSQCSHEKLVADFETA